METRIGWREAGMVGVIVGASTALARISNGFWIALIGGVIVGALGALLYALLMPFVIRWAAKGVRKVEKPEETEETLEP